MNFSSGLRKYFLRLTLFAALMSVLLLPAYAVDDVELTDARAPRGTYTATLEEMAARRLYVYGFIDDIAEEKEPENSIDDESTDEHGIEVKKAELPMKWSTAPDRLDAALMLYRAYGAYAETECPFTDVPEAYIEAVSWLYSAGITKGVGNQKYGTGPITEYQFLVMLSRMLQWNTESADDLTALMKNSGLMPLQDTPDAFTFGEMYQMVCAVLDYADSERCVPRNDKALTPKVVTLYADSCEDAFLQLEQALRYLPEQIDINFSASVPDSVISRFWVTLDWNQSDKTMPMLGATSVRWYRPFSLSPNSDRGYVIGVSFYSEAYEAYASVSNWLNVFQDENYSACLREFYLTNIRPLKNKSEYECVMAAHDLILRLASYDYTEYDEVNNAASGLRPKAHHIVGFFENHEIVCDGYANLLSWMLMHLDVESYVVNGRASDANHAWNKVLVNGKWYNMDVCWDDTGFIPYKYFLKSDDWFNDHRHSFTDTFSATLYQSDSNYF